MMEPTDWDRYYRRPSLAAGVTRRVTAAALLRLDARGGRAAADRRRDRRRRQLLLRPRRCGVAAEGISRR